MKILAWLFLLALPFVGCSQEDDTAANDDGAKRICNPGDFAVCLCKDGSHGTKKCSSTGKSFGTCSSCSGEPIPDGCVPGTDQPCLCANGTEGVHTCNEAGDGFDKCRCDGVIAGDVEECPGLTVSVSGGQEVQRAGTTVEAVDNLPSCGEAGPDAVYQIVPEVSGTLTVRVDAENFDPVLVVWGSECGGEGSTCVNDAPGGSGESTTLPVEAGVPVFVSVDSSGEGGDFSLVAQLEGGSGGASGASNDQCPGSPVAINNSTPTTLSGSTAKASPDYVGAGLCSSATGNDVVYVVQASSSGSLTITLEPEGTFDGALYVRSGSCTAGQQLFCSNEAGPGDPETVVVQAAKGQVYNVFVDGAGSSNGAFSLTMTLSPVFCGDKKVAPPEQCDDGNQDNGDGCSSLCLVEQNPPNTTCPGQPVFVFDSTTDLSGSTASYQDHHAYSECNGITGKGAPDRVYQIMPGKTGTLRAEIVEASFDALLYTYTGACSGAGALEGICGDEIGKGGDTLSAPVTEGEPIWLVVDGWEGNGTPEKGTFLLSLSID